MVINYLDDVLERNGLDSYIEQQRREQCRKPIGNTETEDTVET